MTMFDWFMANSILRGESPLSRIFTWEFWRTGIILLFVTYTSFFTLLFWAKDFPWSRYPEFFIDCWLIVPIVIWKTICWMISEIPEFKKFVLVVFNVH